MPIIQPIISGGGSHILSGCKVTTLFRKLYHLPMENMQKGKSWKLLQINGL